MMYALKPITPADLSRIYPRLIRDFPPEERKKEDHIRRQMESGIEEGWLLMEGDREAGYAFIVHHPEVPFVLLDYLAAEVHGQGAGSALLELLKEHYPQGMMAEVEDPDWAEGDERAVRLRRLNFYRRAGYTPTPFENEIFTVHYLLHVWPEKPARAVAEALSHLYWLQVPEELYRKYVHIAVP